MLQFGCSTKPQTRSGSSTDLSRFTCKCAYFAVEPMGFEPTPSAVQMRPDESTTVRLHSECAANVDILMVGVGWSIRPVSATTAWVGVKARLHMVVEFRTSS